MKESFWDYLMSLRLRLIEEEEERKVIFLVLCDEKETIKIGMKDQRSRLGIGEEGTGR